MIGIQHRHHQRKFDAMAYNVLNHTICAVIGIGTSVLAMANFCPKNGFVVVVFLYAGVMYTCVKVA